MCAHDERAPGARETVTVTAGETSTADPAPPGVYSGDGVFVVGDQPSGGAQRSIPPGRYTVTVTPGREMGSWVRCNNILCGIPGPQDDVLAIENATSPDYSSVMEIEPTDAAIWLQGLTLTRVP